MASPLVTVITPAFNVEEYLRETIQSVLAQTEPNFEYLIVDDGSTDSTEGIAREFAEQDARIRVIAESHNGGAAARNKAIQQAKGEHIAFCDGDDRWLPTFLKKSLTTLRSAPPTIGATFTAYDCIDQKGRLLGKTSTGLGDYDGKRSLAGHCPQGNGSCLLIRKRCFDETGLFDENLRNCVDLDMWLRIQLTSSAPLFRFIPDSLVEWRVRPGSISSSEAKRVDGLDLMFQRYGHVLDDDSRAAAYTWPAALAFYAGRDETAARWAEQVRKADPRYFLHSKHGAVLGVFALVGPRRGRALRSLARTGVRTVRKAKMRIGPISRTGR